MDQPQFNVVRFSNRPGSASRRVTGYLGGVRRRKNFASREEAAAEKASLEIRAIQAASGQRAAVTSLNEVQLREDESIFHRIADKPRSLSFYVDYALASCREPEHQKKVPDAVADYVAARKLEFEDDQLSKPQFRRVEWELKRFEKHLKGRTMAEIRPANVTAFLEIDRSTLKTFNNRRGVLSTFFKFAFHRGWTVENTILRVPPHRVRVRRGSAVTFSTEQARKLMEFVLPFATQFRSGPLCLLYAVPFELSANGQREVANGRSVTQTAASAVRRAHGAAAEVAVDLGRGTRRRDLDTVRCGLSSALRMRCVRSPSWSLAQRLSRQAITQPVEMSPRFSSVVRTPAASSGVPRRVI